MRRIEEGAYQCHKIQLEARNHRCTPGVSTGAVLFNMLINDLDYGTVCTLSRFADDTKLGGVAGTPEGPGATQGVPDRLEQWAGRSLMQFHKDECGKCCTWGGTTS